jgi:hypothetical protein
MSAAFPTACNVFQGCSGTEVAVKRALDLVKSLGPIRVSCGKPAASSAGLGSLILPAITKCVAGLNVLGSAVKGAVMQATVGDGLATRKLKALLDDLPKLSASAPKTVGGLFGGTNLGGLLKPLFEKTKLGAIFRQLPVDVLAAPKFQTGLIEELFKEQFKEAAPPFPAPVAEGSQRKKAKRSFVIASGKFAIEPNTSRNVQLKLSKRARKFIGALRRHGVGAVFTVNVQATLLRGGVPGAAKGTRKVRVRVKPARRRR